MATRRTREFLDGNKIKYAVICHSPAYSAQDVAESAHVPGEHMAKTVVARIDGKLAMAVVPASRQVDMRRLCAAAGAQFAELANESDFAERFEGCQLGAMPPFGNLFGMETYAEKDLAKQEYIAFNAGSHTDVIAMKFDDYRRLVKPRLADISIVPSPSDLMTLQI